MRQKRIFIDLHCPKCQHTKPFRVIGMTLMALDVRCVGCGRAEQVAPLTPEQEGASA